MCISLNGVISNFTLSNGHTAHPALFIIFAPSLVSSTTSRGFFSPSSIHYHTQPVHSTCFLINSTQLLDLPAVERGLLSKGWGYEVEPAPLFIQLDEQTQKLSDFLSLACRHKLFFFFLICLFCCWAEFSLFIPWIFFLNIMNFRCAYFQYNLSKILQQQNLQVKK